MPKCKYHEICGLDANPGGDLCILHSQDPEKDEEEFDKALDVHRQENGHNFQHFVFPGRANFGEVTFTKWASFFYVRFTRGADFSHATFSEGADFSHAKFTESAKFFGATFDKGAKFSQAEFAADADFRLTKFTDWALFSRAAFSKEMAWFSEAEFMKGVNFSHATFTDDAWFAGVTFTEGADFSGTTFGKAAEFFRARFLGRTRFLPRQRDGNHIPIFIGTLVDFREVDMAPDVVVFQDADLQKCHFLGTDLRKAEFTNVEWPEKRGRFEVYDQVDAERKGENDKWAHIEQLYRQLKQNFEDRRDYERARHFHIGEKEMRRKNSGWGLWILLTAYRWVSGYGESWMLPLGWAVGLVILSTFLCLLWGLHPKDGGTTLALTSAWDWLRGFHYSFQVMTLLKPDDLVPIGYAKAVRTFESLAGPILLGLFALALRQRLKR